MKQLLTIISEKLIGFNETTGQYFDTLYDSGDYTIMGVFILAITLVILFIYYKAIDPILPKVWHWVLSSFVSILLVWTSCFFLLYNSSMKWDILNYVAEDYEPLMNPTMFVIEISLVMALVSIIPLIVYTFFLRFFSVNNKRNPF